MPMDDRTLIVMLERNMEALQDKMDKQIDELNEYVDEAIDEAPWVELVNQRIADLEATIKGLQEIVRKQGTLIVELLNMVMEEEVHA